MTRAQQKFPSLLISICCIAFACTKDKTKGGRGDGKGIVAVRSQTLKAMELPRTIELVSVLVGRKQAEVYSRVAGKISFIGPDEGKKVREGELLFRVDRSDPGESFLATPVVSPIAGWIGRWSVNSVGTLVTAQQPIVTVVDDEVLRVVVELPTSEWLLVSPQTPTHVTVGDQTRDGKVFAITRSAETASSRGAVSVEIDNSAHSWKAGMVAKVVFDLDTKPRLVVPATALSITDLGSFVFQIKDGKAVRRPVKFALITNDQVELTHGVSDGDEIVTEGVQQVGDGIPVNVVRTEKGKS